VPYFDTELIEQQPRNPVSDRVQLSYVLPRHSLHLLPKKIENRLLQHFGRLYKTDYEFKWAYCKYFWECHVEFPEINLSELEKTVNE